MSQVWTTKDWLLAQDQRTLIIDQRNEGRQAKRWIDYIEDDLQDMGVHLEEAIDLTR